MLVTRVIGTKIRRRPKTSATIPSTRGWWAPSVRSATTMSRTLHDLVALWVEDGQAHETGQIDPGRLAAHGRKGFWGGLSTGLDATGPSPRKMWRGLPMSFPAIDDMAIHWFKSASPSALAMLCAVTVWLGGLRQRSRPTEDTAARPCFRGAVLDVSPERDNPPRTFY